MVAVGLVVAADMRTGPNWGETFGPTATNPGTPPSAPGIDAWANLTNRSGVNGKTNYEGLNCPANTNNQLMTCSLTFDAAGNVTGDGTLDYSYDLENRMTKFIGSTTDIYSYDGDSQRVKKNVGAVTLYWYGAAGNVLDETNGTGTLVSEYIYFDGRRVARRDADNSVKYYFSDNLGSASVITNSAGAMPPLAESDYYPYGGEIPITTGDANHYKFTGKERDSESGLDNFGARYFTSSLGRFMTPDWALRPTAVPYAVFGDPQTLNLYTYVENSPLNRVDADGHEGEVNNSRSTPAASNPCAKDSQKSCDAKKQAEEAQNHGFWWNLKHALGIVQTEAEKKAESATYQQAKTRWEKAHPGRSYALHMLNLQMGMTPMAGFAAVGEAEEAGGIIISAARLTKVLQAHTDGGLLSAGKSLFNAGEDVEALIQGARSTGAVAQAGGNFERVVDAGRIIGTDRTTGAATSIYTVITDSAGNMITAFPGRP
jgi:RHS repeat-associated protein